MSPLLPLVIAALVAVSGSAMPPPGESERMAWFEARWGHPSGVLEAVIGHQAADEHPPLPARSGTGRRIVYSNSDLWVWLVDDREQVLDSYPVSGHRGWPRPGAYAVFSKSEDAWAGYDGITMRWMVRFAIGHETNIGFHDIPLDGQGRPLQTVDELGTYQGGGCVRQEASKARLLYAWADLGTVVIVTP
jgi:hypothetical protein